MWGGRRRSFTTIVWALLAAALLMVVGPRVYTAGRPEPRQGTLPQWPRRDARDLAPGKFLVAREGLVDPNFAESVVLLVDRDERGWTGLIINRRTRTRLSTIVPRLKGKGADDPVFFGGPVEGTGIIALLRSDSPRKDTRHVFADIYLIDSQKLFESTVAKGTGADRFRTYVGSSGWAAGQLEHEADLGAWLVLNADPRGVFDPDPDSLWKRELQRAGERAVSNRPNQTNQQTADSRQQSAEAVPHSR